MGTTPKLFLRHSGKPALDLIDPRGTRGCKMQMIARPLCQPTLGHGRLMGPIVVQNKMDVKIRRHGMINRIKRFAEFNRSMPTVTLTDHLTRLHIKGRKERRRSIAAIIVGASLDLPRTHGQDRLGSIQRLHLRLFIHTQDQGSIRWIQIQPHNISHFLNEQRIFGQLKRFGPMGLKCKSSPDPTDGTLGQSRRLRPRRGTPVCRIFGSGLQGLCDNSLRIPITDLPGSSGTTLIEQAIQTTCNKPRPPFPDRGPSNVKSGSDIAIYSKLPDYLLELHPDEAFSSNIDDYPAIAALGFVVTYFYTRSYIPSYTLPPANRKREIAISSSVQSLYESDNKGRRGF